MSRQGHRVNPTFLSRTRRQRGLGAGLLVETKYGDGRLVTAATVVDRAAGTAATTATADLEC